MAFARLLCRVVFGGAAAALIAGCAGPVLVSEDLTAGAGPATEFSSDDQTLTLVARFDAALAADAPLTVEWRFPDGELYLRKPVRRSLDDPMTLETAIPVSGKAPGRHPGLWHVRLLRDGHALLDRSFTIAKPATTARAAGAQFAGFAYCGPSRWNDAAISGGRSDWSARVPGAWVGADLLSAAGATYSGAVLLTGCAPG